MSSSQDPWDQDWRKLTLDLHGMDFAQGKKVMPSVEPLFETSATEPTEGQRFAFVAPVAANKLGELRALAQRWRGPEHAVYAAARAAIGVRREAAYLETSSAGTALVVYWRADNPAASLQQLSGLDDIIAIPTAQLATIAGTNRLIAQYPKE
jgi:hypothetical protein